MLRAIFPGHISSSAFGLPQRPAQLTKNTQWPLWYKDSILLIISLCAAVVGAFGPMLSPGVVEIANGFGITVSMLNHSTAFLILTLAISLFITNPVAKKWGKRPIYILSISIMLASSCWAGAAQGYPSFEGSRILSGFGMAPFEVLVQASLSDLYFVHQRATRIAVWNLFLLTGIAGGSLVSGYIIQDLTYRWTFWICAILFGVLVVAVIFVVPETSYRRPGGGFIPATERKTRS